MFLVFEYELATPGPICVGKFRFGILHCSLESSVLNGWEKVARHIWDTKVISIEKVRF